MSATLKIDFVSDISCPWCAIGWTQFSKAVAEQSGGGLELKEATLYTAFRRLETAGCIRSYWGDEQSGARRRYYSLTDVGLEKLLKDCEAWRETRQVLDQLLGGEQE